MSVKLRKRKNKDGTTSLRLDIYKDGKRSYELLSNLQLSKGDREANKELLLQAEAIRLSRSVELERSNYNLDSEAGKKTIVAVWMQSYVDSYTKKDKANMQGVLNRFVSFLTDQGLTGLTFGNLTGLIIEDFVDYLQARSQGEGARSYYARFKKMLKYAFRKKVMKVNVLDSVERGAKGKAKKKDVLSIDEIKLLSQTPINSPDVRRAALFCTVTGLAWVDVKRLEWDNIKGWVMELVRAKLDSENVTVTIPLNDTAIKLLGKKAGVSDHIFNLPSANGANATLKDWVKRAGINKKITWHNLRHSYGTNLIFNNVDILTTSKLLGHSTTAQTMRYVQAADEMKQRGTDKLNFDL
ncbi:MAG: site-specific integrase [Pyrinomonadaceae bacterium]|nr:site-specific integrase [Sphingobacteriaceae bacterium]